MDVPSDCFHGKSQRFYPQFIPKEGVSIANGGGGERKMLGRWQKRNLECSINKDGKGTSSELEPIEDVC